ncbi:MAG: serine/threonine protein kinase [Planctomycetes bacterium]|nr:serine/threonine protein kinase [Planctomycetota bacterium]
MPAPERAAWLDRECGGDAQLLHDLTTLLEHDTPAGTATASPHPIDGPPIVAGAVIEAAFAEATASPVRGPASHAPDKLVGDYLICHEIGRGGFGVVYLAEQQPPEVRIVALKILASVSLTHRSAQRFEEERRAQANLSHPGIARIYSGGTTPAGQPYFAMEFVSAAGGREPAPRITDYADRHALSVPKRVELFLLVCNAVQHAHQHGILHRDLKPSNILVADEGAGPQPKVIDFGLARHFANEQSELDGNRVPLTLTSEILGTPDYMSPEQAAGKPVDSRSDIYSLGVVLYELLCGCLPIASGHGGWLEQLRAVREQEPLRPTVAVRRPSAAADKASDTASRHLASQLRGDLETILLRALEKDVARRFATVAAFADDLTRYLHHRPLESRPRTITYTLAKFVRRHRSFSAAVVIAFTALVLSTFWSLYLLDITSGDRDRAREEAAKSRQTARFLEDMLSGVGPAVALGRDTTILREILAKTEKSIDTDLGGNPEAEAEIRGTLGRLYGELDMLAEAEAMQRRALAIWRRLYGEEHDSIATTLFDLAGLQFDQGDLDAAEAGYRQALAMRCKMLGSDTLAVAEVRNHLGFLLQEKGKYPEAEEQDRESLRIRTAILGPEHPLVAKSLNNLSILEWRRGELAAAEDSQRRVLAMRRKFLGIDNPEVAKSLNNLSLILFDQSKIREAEAIDLELLEMAIRMTGPKHSWIAHATNAVAADRAEQGRYVEAEQGYQEALAMYRELLGPEHPDSARTLDNLANTHAALGRLEDAEREAREALVIRRSACGEVHADTADSLHDCAAVLLELGRAPEAEALLSKAVETRSALFGRSHPDVAKALATLGRALAMQGKADPALAALQEALAIGTATLGRAHPAVAETLELLATTKLELGVEEGVETLLSEAWQTLKAARPDDWRPFAAEARLGAFLRQQGKAPEAEPRLVSGFEGMRSRLSRMPFGRRGGAVRAAEQLARLYLDTARPAEAEALKGVLMELRAADRGR